MAKEEEFQLDEYQLPASERQREKNRNFFSAFSFLIKIVTMTTIRRKSHLASSNAANA